MMKTQIKFGFSLDLHYLCNRNSKFRTDEFDTFTENNKIKKSK